MFKYFNKNFYFLIFVLITFSLSAKQLKTLTPPDAIKEPHYLTIHDTTLVDDYYYFRNIDDPRVKKYIDEENEYTKKMMLKTKKLQKKLYNEILKKVDKDEISVPERRDSFLYYYKDLRGKDYTIFCRRKDKENSPEEIIIDINEFAKNYQFFDLNFGEISSDHRMLSYSFDTLGDENYTLRILDLKTKKNIEIPVIDNITSFAFNKYNDGFFYTIQNDISRSYALRYYDMKTGKDTLLFQEDDDRFSVYLNKTRDKDYIFLSVSSSTSSEYYYINSDDRDLKLNLLVKREKDVEYSFDHSGLYFYYITNKDCINFDLKRFRIDSTIENSTTVIKGSDTLMIEGFDAFENFLSVYERVNGRKKLKFYYLNTGDSKYFDFGEENCTFYPFSNSSFKRDSLRVAYMSLKTPSTVIDIDVKSLKGVVKKVDEIKGYRKENYVTEYLYAKAEDGELIPISLIYNKKYEPKNLPLLLTGYGAYGMPSEPYFSTSRLSLLDRGVIFGIAHIRGGGDKGRKWYNDGKMFKKMNTFTDFISCAQYLIEKGYTSPEKLAIEGGSAGGLLIGAVLNLKPELFKGAILSVPFVDLINTMVDTTLPLTAGEFEEWGNPQIKEQFDYMIKYSPYDNIKPTNYPNILVKSSIFDTRVMYWEPLKWVAKMRDNKLDNNVLLLKMRMSGGHGGSSGKYNWYEEIAFDNAFLLYYIWNKKR
ncbi:MAG: Protease II [candidate division TA06 bacterium 32_111]|uniref:Protease II n=2 Tax=Bacteria candidate phyla TaxID=1783234 RepID=A0A101I2X2_UNCT6|nr:MAG: Protease II [candidate division TA06 bacterium 32_111]KUK88007.1 MAG: Protease II [candidate division TA06 bacterium 34_109]HAF06935.1 oligopeptidase B [candidate division WOR-3 bacterium]HCP16849.1 oligopeptidase B [candidate division WOR-3 bacterium]